ncbi:type IV secretory system conjugative DNA transfer family protein [Pelosinus propionicus]|uniref:Type IV secretory pathway, VirD4 component, TraG/TraD family ATPase n=1 Tax=Pelosinus propionicus DSM 13327 TaxID=1123291 RepID=A0A1I4HQA7_9FIRM|nr:type IV secretion system DNA-binding domain-containing protein [Pelosinus propionicus]SFL43943.1 Type IV secretory pathway, VirD4 component, TraG/TraD family ATPase [Pelosinus propionicus DSM 13327]
MQGYHTHETFLGDLRMYLNMFRKAFLVGLFIQFLMMGYTIYYIFEKLDTTYIEGTNIKLPFSVSLKYYSGFPGLFSKDIKVETELLPYAKGWTELPVEYYRIVADYVTNDTYAYYGHYAEQRFKWSFGCYIFSVVYLIIFIGTAKSQKDEKFIRGGSITPSSVFNKQLLRQAKKNPLSSLRIGKTILPFEMESKHILILGTAGSGKGVLINQLVKQINNRKRSSRTNDKCIFYDPKGEFVAKQLQSDSYIFSPFDKRSLAWNIFNELEIPPDYDVMSRSLFASPDTKDSYWYNCASDVFRTGLVYLKAKNTTSNSDLWNFFSQPLLAIQEAFKTLPISEQGALKHIDKSDSPASASIISILQERIQFFRYLVDLDGDFSFRKFIRDQHENEGQQPNLFILNIEQYSIIFKPLMTLAIDTMCREALSMPDKLDRRIFFIIDELGTLNRMDSILKLETVGRSKGACLICANQDLGRIEEQYGRANLKSFYNNFNTTVTLRIREPETADFLSRAIGEQQLIKTSHSRQMSPSEVGDRKSISEQDKTERLILPTEFQALPDLHAIVNIAGFGISKITIPALFYPEQHPNFIMRDFLLPPDPPEPTTAVAVQEDFEPISFTKLKI